MITRKFDGYDYRFPNPEKPLRAYVWINEITGSQYRQLFETEQEADDHQGTAESALEQV